MTFNRLVGKVEDRWLQQLYGFVMAEFSDTWLPSHDHTHHLRVWQFARKLMETLFLRGHHFGEDKLEQLIMAVFFHDTGLTRTLEASHGTESREICRKFLTLQPSISADNRDQILNAVEKHDDKMYDASLPAGRPGDLLTLLAVSDDLDAFGAIGVFRYLEIYMHREIPLQMIPLKVIENLEKRFGYLVQQYGELKDFVREHQNRYQYTVDFYRELDTQQHSANEPASYNGPLLVVKLLIEKVLVERVHLNEIALHVKDMPMDAFSSDYFRQLQ